MGRHERSLGWTENPLKLYKFKRSDQADRGFSIGTWKSFNTHEMSEIYFSTHIPQTALGRQPLNSSDTSPWKVLLF